MTVLKIKSDNEFLFDAGIFHEIKEKEVYGTPWEELQNASRINIFTRL